MNMKAFKSIRLTFLCLCAFCVLLAAFIMTASAAATGNGTSEAPYVVDNYTDFLNCINNANSAETVYINLSADINISKGKQLKPSFNLVLDLSEHTISTITSTIINANGHKITVKNGNVDTSIGFFSSGGVTEDHYVLENLNVTTSEESGSCIWIGEGTVTATNCTFTTTDASSTPIKVTANTTYTLTNCNLIAADSGKAYVYTSGTLILDGKTITESCASNEYSSSLFKNINISLGQDIKVNYYVSKKDFENPEMKFTINDCTKTVSGELVGEQYKFVFDGVAPHWIGDTITAELIVGGDSIESKDYSVLRYLNALKDKSAEDLKMSSEKYDAMKVLVNDLLFYGGRAQCYKDYKTNELVSKGITGTAFEKIVADDAAKTDGSYVKFTGANMYFDSVNKLMFKFEATNLDGVVLTLKVNDGKEANVGYTDNGDGSYLIVTDAIYATGFDDIYTVTAYKSGAADGTLTYSVKSYVYSMQNDKGYIGDLVKAVYNYGLAAKAYEAIE